MKRRVAYILHAFVAIILGLWLLQHIQMNQEAVGILTIFGIGFFITLLPYVLFFAGAISFLLAFFPLLGLEYRSFQCSLDLFFIVVYGFLWAFVVYSLILIG